MNFRALTAALATGLLAYSGSASAYLLYFGEDVNNSATVPLTLIPNSSGAASSFMSKLSGVGTETFETTTVGTSTSPSMALSFPGFGGTSLTATLTGGDGVVAEVAPGDTDGAGRYSIPSPGSKRYLDVEAGGLGNFQISFGQAIAAFGFYGIDIGDFSGKVALDFFNGSTLVTSRTLNTTANAAGVGDGSVLYFGLIAEGSAEEFDRVAFRTTTGDGDFFAFDNFTIANRGQIKDDTPPTNPTPIPGTLLLAGLGLAGLGAMRRRAR